MWSEVKGVQMMSGKHFKAQEVSCCIKYFIFGFNIIFWVSIAFNTQIYAQIYWHVLTPSSHCSIITPWWHPQAVQRWAGQCRCGPDVVQMWSSQYRCGPVSADVVQSVQMPSGMCNRTIQISQISQIEGKESEYSHNLQSLQQKSRLFFGIRNMTKQANKQQGIGMHWYK